MNFETSNLLDDGRALVEALQAEGTAAGHAGAIAVTALAADVSRLKTGILDLWAEIKTGRSLTAPHLERRLTHLLDDEPDTPAEDTFHTGSGLAWTFTGREVHASSGEDRLATMTTEQATGLAVWLADKAIQAGAGHARD